MSALTQPPYLLVGIGGNLRGQQGAVLRGMPFGGQSWIHRGEIIFTLLASPTVAYGTGQRLP